MLFLSSLYGFKKLHGVYIKALGKLKISILERGFVIEWLNSV